MGKVTRRPIKSRSQLVQALKERNPGLEITSNGSDGIEIRGRGKSKDLLGCPTPFRMVMHTATAGRITNKGTDSGVQITIRVTFSN